MSLRRSKTVLLIMIALLAGCQCGIAKRVGTAAADPPPDGGSRRSAAPAAADADAFPVNVEQALLFDPRMGPLNAQLADEAGPHLLIAGRVRNNARRLVHRATVYATLAATFGERTALERHSGGLGFAPRVDSNDPWRPDSERSFRCVTRPLDPIYLELRPQVIEGALTLTAQDPLGYRFRGELVRFGVDWQPVFGAMIDRTASVREDGDARCAPQQKDCRVFRNQRVRLVYQRGAAFKAFDADGADFWLGAEQLVFDPPTKTAAAAPAPSAPPAAPAAFPLVARLANGVTVRVSRFNEQAGAAAGKVYVAALVFVNDGPKPARTPAPNQFALDLSAGAYATPAKLARDGDALGRTIELRPGQSVEATLRFAPESDDWLAPFDLELHVPKQTPVRFPLFRALAAVTRD